MKKKGFLYRYKDLVLYTFFGVCTTIINVAIYNVFYNKFKVTNIASTIIAWVAAIIFAFITNKIFVFSSKSFNWEKLRYELFTFLACRLLTGFLDVAIMIVAVDVMNGDSITWKAISNVFVIILNYVASRLVIFKK